MTAQKWFTDLVNLAGITPNGSQVFDPQILNPSFYLRVRRDGLLGLGESFLDRWWTCAKLDEFAYRLLDHKVEEHMGLFLPVVYGAIRAWLLNLQSVRRASQVGKKHYDLGNELFEFMLGQNMAYSCGFWKGAESLEEAQYAKFKLICDKLCLERGMRVLDIGCGWGSFAKYAAEHYGVSVIGLTVSQKQAEYARQRCQGLDVEIRFQDYRSFHEHVDRIVSIGSWEHVGVKNYRRAMVLARECLSNDGLFLLHTIGSLRSGLATDPWVEKYIFPNGMLPSLKQITQSAEELFVVEDVHNFGADYDPTLMAWHRNFVNAWPELADRYGERFFRMWSYYLLICAGAFRARHLQLWQVVLSPRGVRGGYHLVR